MRRPPFFSSEGSLPAAFSSLQGWDRKGVFHPFWSRWDQNRGQWDWKWEEWGTWQQRIGWSHLFVGAHPSAPDVANFTNYLLSAMSYECKVKDLPPYCLHTNCTCTKIFTLLKTDLSQMCHLTFLQIKITIVLQIFLSLIQINLTQIFLSLSQTSRNTGCF